MKEGKAGFKIQNFWIDPYYEPLAWFMIGKEVRIKFYVIVVSQAQVEYHCFYNEFNCKGEALKLEVSCNKINMLLVFVI